MVAVVAVVFVVHPLRVMVTVVGQLLVALVIQLVVANFDLV